MFIVPPIQVYDHRPTCGRCGRPLDRDEIAANQQQAQIAAGISQAFQGLVGQQAMSSLVWCRDCRDTPLQPAQ